MRFNLLSDSDWESKLESILDELQDLGINEYFESKDYGLGLVGITVIAMCRDPKLLFKQRIRFSRKDRKLYLDIMLDLDVMRVASHEERRRRVANSLSFEVPAVVSRYEIDDFDSARFLSDLKTFVAKTGWI